MDKRIGKVGMTRHILWKEYKEKHPGGYQFSQFCKHYSNWAHRVTPVMRIEHKAGDKMFVDYAGKTLQLVDKQTGEIKEVQFFVALLGYSQYTYAEASMSQQKNDFIQSVEKALLYFEGVPKAIVTDNLKAAVTKSSRYEPTLNETFADFAEHYGTTILPTRAYKPKDKALVEGVIRILYTRIYTALEQQTFTDLKALNSTIGILLAHHNQTQFSHRPYSRTLLFNEVEKQELLALPVHPYQLKEQSFATVMMNGHVCLGKDKHYYSVPYPYIKKKVKLRYSEKEVEIYYQYGRIAVHPRDKSPYNYSTVTEHLASAHRHATEWTPQRFLNWASSIGTDVELYIQEVLRRKKHPEQAYKSCMGILSFAGKAGNQRLTKACKRALGYGIYNYNIIKTILEKGLDQLEEDNDPEQTTPSHTNIRGKEYYQ